MTDRRNEPCESDLEEEEEEYEDDGYEDGVPDNEDDDERANGIAHSGVAENDIRDFEKTEAQLEGLYEEVAAIAKKKPDDLISKFKLRFVNQVLGRANQLLGDIYRPFPDFEQFDADTLPTASDVVMMLSQYLRSADKFRKDHTYKHFNAYYWRVSDSKREIRAKRPRDMER